MSQSVWSEDVRTKPPGLKQNPLKCGTVKLQKLDELQPLHFSRKRVAPRGAAP